MWPCVRAGFTLGANQAEDNYSRQVAEVHSESFLEGWLSYLKELGVPEDNLAWTRAAPIPEFPESPAPYSPLILPGLNKEEFLIRPEEDEVVPEPVPDLAAASDIKAVDPMEEVGRMVAEVRLRVYLGKICGSGTRARSARLSPPRLLPRKKIIIGIEFCALLGLG